VRGRALWVVAAVAAAVAFFVIWPFFRQGSNNAVGPAGLAGSPAPVFDLLDDRGAAASLAGYRGKVVVMNLWASWCPPCRAEMPDLQRLYARYERRGVVVVGVNEGESAQRAAAFAQSLQIRFPIWIDDQQRYGRIYAALGLPTTVVVGRDGTVVHGYDGALTYSQMQSAVEPLAAK
jgi:peroxiredoxin